MDKKMCNIYQNGTLEQFLESFTPYIKYYANKIYNLNRILFKEEDFDDILQKGYECVLLIYKKYSIDNYNIFNQLFVKRYYFNTMISCEKRKNIVKLYYKYVSIYKKYPTYNEFINYLKQNNIVLRTQSIKHYIEDAHLKFALGDSKIEYTDKILNKMIYDEIEKNFVCLNEREKEIITSHILENKSLEEIGKNYGISRERVRQINQNGILKLRMQVKK